LTLPLWTQLFGPLKQALRGWWFTKDQQLDVTVHPWLVSQPKNFLFWGNKADCAVDKVHFKQGDYVEKLCSCKISTLVFINTNHNIADNY